MSNGEFDGYGGRYVPGALEEPLAELAAAYDEVATTETFQTAFRELLESSHAVARAIQFAEAGDHDTILVNLSGRGDKDVQTAAEKSDR
ncbi:Tryptophan synthase beta chain [Natrarchaeobaculum sulfurireducens]|uniref:Tryptophan synthase beta chain n=1 Tax=Natrarchaeobaculum sulfurireducens TaxID=2044521 RepID=A0A346PPW0_9EURY|nr:Tryptophan synthase beta chain [Natrarchaeobaculum sulfurireducens]AXR81555.1 Tryptophan synthase beta chain [Natrarchaeobaculum sulfurireducens]